MPTLNEMKYASLLIDTGAHQPITLNELECLKLKQLGYIGTLQDMYHQFFTDQGVPSGTIDQRWMAYLNSIGYTSGTLNERMYQYYSFISKDVTAVFIDTQVAGACIYNPPTTTDCEAVGNYTARDVNLITLPTHGYGKRSATICWITPRLLVVLGQ